MDKVKILTIGGRGFLGSYTTSLLKKEGYEVMTFDRKPGGNIHIQGSILAIKELEKAIQAVDYVVNFVGLSPIKAPKRSSYFQVHVNGIQNIVLTCQKFKKSLIHISATGIDSTSVSDYSRTKALAEKIVVESDSESYIIAPSFVFGKESELSNILNKLSLFRIVPYPNFKSRVQPVFVGDIAKVILKILNGNIEERYLELAGEEVMSIFELSKIYLRKKHALAIPLPAKSIRFVLKLLGKLKILPYAESLLLTLEKDYISDDARYIGIDYKKYSEWVESEV